LIKSIGLLKIIDETKYYSKSSKTRKGRKGKEREGREGKGKERKEKKRKENKRKGKKKLRKSSRYTLKRILPALPLILTEF
jgi:hypothetical protein